MNFDSLSSFSFLTCRLHEIVQDVKALHTIDENNIYLINNNVQLSFYYIRLHFSPIINAQARERISWPLQIFNDIVRQFTNQVSSSGSNWLSRQNTYTMVIGNGEDGEKQNIFVLRSKSGPRFMPFEDTESNDQFKLPSPESSKFLHYFCCVDR